VHVPEAACLDRDRGMGTKQMSATLRALGMGWQRMEVASFRELTIVVVHGQHA